MRLCSDLDLVHDTLIFLIFRTCHDNLLGVNMSRWGGERNPVAKRRNTPWARRAAVMQDYQHYVRKKMQDYCPWHRWQP